MEEEKQVKVAELEERELTDEELEKVAGGATKIDFLAPDLGIQQVLSPDVKQF